MDTLAEYIIGLVIGFSIGSYIGFIVGLRVDSILVELFGRK